MQRLALDSAVRVIPVDLFHAERLGGAAIGFQVAKHAFLHGLPRLPLAARQDHPGRTLAPRLGLEHIVDEFQRGGECLAGLPGESAQLEPRRISKPALLIGIEVDGSHQPINP